MFVILRIFYHDITKKKKMWRCPLGILLLLIKGRRPHATFSGVWSASDSGLNWSQSISVHNSKKEQHKQTDNTDELPYNSHLQKYISAFKMMQIIVCPTVVILTEAFSLVVAIITVTLVTFAAVAAWMIETVCISATNIWIQTLIDVWEREKMGKQSLLMCNCT